MILGGIAPRPGEIEFQDEAQTSKTNENGDIYSMQELHNSSFTIKIPSGAKIDYCHPLGHGAVFTDVTFSPTDSTLIACSRDSLIHFYEPFNGVYDYKNSSKEIAFEFAVWWVRFSRDGVELPPQDRTA